MSIIEKKPDREQEVLDKLLENIDKEGDVKEQLTMAESYEKMKAARANTAKTKQGWVTAVLSGIGGIGTLVLSYFMFKKPYDMQEKAVYVTDKIGQDSIRDAKSFNKDGFKKFFR